MLNNSFSKLIGLVILSVSIFACKTPNLVQKTVNKTVPQTYANSADTAKKELITWKEYFTDLYLIDLIDSALVKNQELNIILQEIAISHNEVRVRKGEYLPFINLQAGADLEKVGRYTRQGANDANTDIKRGRKMPDPLSNLMLAANAQWEIDIWHKLRNAKAAAVDRYLASIEGKNFMVTNLIAEIANAYYELLALDNQREILKQNIEIQSNALEIVRLQKQAAKVTELAVRRFEAEVLSTRSLQFEIDQQIIETENWINFLIGRFPAPVPRDPNSFNDLTTESLIAGIPAQLLENRPDIKQAELELTAADLDVKSAKANFYPSLDISAAIGLEAFKPEFLVRTPESMLYALAGDLVGPLINRNAIKAAYYSANAKQLQAIYSYEKTVLSAYIEVVNQQSMLLNLKQSYDLKLQEVEALKASITISNDLFSSARADYMEVLLTQRDALEARFELVETKMKQMHAKVDIYQALGGGWK